MSERYIRPETSADHEAIRHVNTLAFGQDDEARLVNALRKGGFVRLSLVAEEAGQIVGHSLFSDLAIITEAGVVPSLPLAPMAVLPELQKQGIGSALVRRGLHECRQQGHKIVVVVGHPAFYPRFGFSPRLAANLASPVSVHRGDFRERLRRAKLVLEPLAVAAERMAQLGHYPDRIHRLPLHRRTSRSDLV